MKNYRIVVFLIMIAVLVSNCSDSSSDAISEPDLPVYTISISIADRVTNVDLEFGLVNSSEIKNEEAPPPPPEGALNAYFEKDGLKYVKDIRGSSSNLHEWILEYQRGQFEELLLNWEITYEESSDGDILMLFEDDEREVNMRKTNSIELLSDDTSKLFIKYRN